METKGKVILRFDQGLNVGSLRSTQKSEAVKRLFELRKWCHQNIKNKWHSYELTAGGGKEKYFFVFEFESKKDEMLFRLYTGNEQ